MIRKMAMLLSLLFVTAPFGLAATHEDVSSQQSVLVGADSVFYPVKVFFENQAVRMNLNSTARAEERILLAEKRIREAASASNPERAITDYERQLRQAQLDVEGSEEQENIEQRVIEVTNQHLDQLQALIETAPQEAKQGLQQAINASEKANLGAASMITNRGGR